jgi:DNA-binding transcriptional LysR family regulator
MNFKSIDFNWEHAKVFLIIAREGSLTSAAKVLNVSQPTLSRHINALEAELGFDLFERTSTGLLLTVKGQLLFEHVERMAECANAFSLEATKQSTTIKGDVRISAPEVFAGLMLPKLVLDINEQYPDINVEIQANNKVADLLHREADIAIRTFRPTEVELIVKKLVEGKGRLYCAKNYLHSGVTVNQHTIENVTFINFDPAFPIANNPHYLNISSNYKLLKTENYLVGWEMVKNGLGIGFMDERVGDNEASVVRALPHKEPLKFELWLVVHRELRNSPSLKAVFDCIVRHLSSKN